MVTRGEFLARATSANNRSQKWSHGASYSREFQATSYSREFQLTPTLPPFKSMLFCEFIRFKPVVLNLFEVADSLSSAICSCGPHQIQAKTKKKSTRTHTYNFSANIKRRPKKRSTRSHTSNFPAKIKKTHVQFSSAVQKEGADPLAFATPSKSFADHLGVRGPQVEKH